VVEGKWNDDLMKQIKAPGPITKENAAMLDARAKKLAAAGPAASAKAPAGKQAAPAAKPVAAAGKATSHPAGEKLYKSACIACHSTGVANAPKLGDKAA